MNRLYSLPEDILSIIFKIVHNQKIKEINKEFIIYVKKVKYYHTIQELAPSRKYIRDHFMYIRYKNIDFVESCFRHPTMLKYL
jgi:hypothetical protein